MLNSFETYPTKGSSTFPSCNHSAHDCVLPAPKSGSHVTFRFLNSASPQRLVKEVLQLCDRTTAAFGIGNLWHIVITDQPEKFPELASVVIHQRMSSSIQEIEQNSCRDIWSGVILQYTAKPLPGILYAMRVRMAGVQRRGDHYGGIKDNVSGHSLQELFLLFDLSTLTNVSYTPANIKHHECQTDPFNTPIPHLSTQKFMFETCIL